MTAPANRPTCHDVRCPGCAKRMRLRLGKLARGKDGTGGRWHYICPDWPTCKHSHGAHDDGRPLGTPADLETREWRRRAHAALDRLHKEGLVCRNEAYDRLARAMRLTRETAHIALFDAAQCRQVMTLTTRWYRQLVDERKRTRRTTHKSRRRELREQRAYDKLQDKLGHDDDDFGDQDAGEEGVAA